MNPKRVLPDVYKTKRRKPNETSDANESAMSTRSALATLKSLFPVEKFENRLPAIIMKHQIYSLTQSRTEVDKHLNELSSSGRIRTFKLGEEEDDIAIVYLQDYFQHIKSKSKSTTVVNFLYNVVDKCPDLSYDRKSLFDKYDIGDNTIRELVQCGVLTVREVGSWWLSIPGAGEFMKSFTKGRQKVLGMLRRAKYKEILQQELESRNLGKQAKLGIQYHIHDLIGADLVTVFETSSGKVIRLRDSE